MGYDDEKERLRVDFNVEHGKGDQLFHDSERLGMIMETALQSYVQIMGQMMAQNVANMDDRQKLAQTAERERIEAQEKYKGGD